MFFVGRKSENFELLGPSQIEKYSLESKNTLFVRLVRYRWLFESSSGQLTTCLLAVGSTKSMVAVVVHVVCMLLDA